MQASTTLARLLGARDPAKAVLFAVALAVAVLELFFVHALDPLQNRVLDFMVRQNARALVPDPDIVIVDIDDASLAKMEEVAGSWPWPRAVHAEMVQGMLREQPRAIVFDIFFSERDKYRPDSDRMFNDALAGNTNIFFPVHRLDAAGDKKGPLAADIAPLIGMVKGPEADPQARLALQPPLALDPPYWRVGAVNFLADEDGIGRRYHLNMDLGGWKLPSLPAKVAAGLGYPVPDVPDMLMSWRGGVHAFPHISYADLYQDFGRETPQRPAMELKDKIIIIGADASGLNDLRATPISSVYPGAQILATAIDNLKNQRPMRAPPAELLPCVVLAGLLSLFWLLNRGANVGQVGGALLLTTVLVLAATWWALGRRWLLPSVVALLLLWSYYFAGAVQAYLAERKSRQKTVREFSRFVNPFVVQQLLEAGGLQRAGEAREVSVLFSDIRGFTTLSENRTPQEVVQLLNRYFSLQVEVVFRHGGSLDKFIGDCIMAFWGAPLDDAAHARNAVTAAMEMADVLQQFKKELGEEDADFDVGIGIHSGLAVVGLIGSEQRREYTAIGDTVNLASRIEGLTKGVSRILVSEDTMNMCGDAFEFTPYGAFDVKGREQAVNLFGPARKGEKA
jgi:adenylate cyclase